MDLILPSLEYESSYRAYIRELGQETRYPFPLDYEHGDFPALLRRLANLANGTEVPEGFVPSSTFWLVDRSELIGVSNLRHYLNERIRQHGGHIGLGIRPSSRGRGLGRILLARTILEARARGIDEIHIHCRKGNVASARLIIGSGGVLSSEVALEGTSEIVQRFRVAAVIRAPRE
ncbi:MAG: GNAT family N-acetyltransferase [Pseudomonadota bacterium]